MYNTVIITIVMNAVPFLALAFVVALVSHKVYTKIRARYNVKVNCWFCNENTKVAYAERNSWTCPHCEQYNGFKKDGDYNREIYQQLDCSNLSFSTRHSDEVSFNNGLCNTCNEAQRIKVEKLAQFEPKNESRFESELKVYKAQLEEQYRLCATCDRHLKKVLREKKKMVLGSKFLQYVLQGANMVKQPHLLQLKQQQRIIWKKYFKLLTNLIAFLNICCLIWSLNIPELSLQYLNDIFGDFLGSWLFHLGSHVVAFVRVLRSYLEICAEFDIIVKLRLFCRTVFLMLLYSLGLKLPQVMRVNFSAVFMPFSPYAALISTFAYNMLDNWRSSWYIGLVCVWGVVAADFIEVPWLSSEIMLLISSLTTLAVNLTNQKESSFEINNQNNSQSFHRLYSEDYLSDEDTLSLLSEQLNSSAASQVSDYSLKQQRISPRAQLRKSPLAAANLSANNNFQNLNNSTNNIGFRFGSSLHSPYAASVCSLGSQQARGTSLYASSMDLRSPPHYNPYMTAAEKPMQPMQQQQRFNGSLLSPSRFSTTSINSPTATQFYTANQTHSHHAEAQQHYNVSRMMHEARGMNNLSRCSSRSSGFESQPNERGGLCGRESIMSEMNPTYMEHDCGTAFQPVMPVATSPFSVNYVPTVGDRFNFQQFDAQLPRYRPGDLLRKFKDTQNIYK